MIPPGGQILVIFGASGDLTRRKLIPALYNLWVKDFLPVQFYVLGVSRTPLSDEDFRKQMLISLKEEIKPSSKRVEDFLSLLNYISINTEEPVDYFKLKERLDSISKKLSIQENYIFYLASPPLLYPVIAESLSIQGLADETKGWKRIIVEKPFGYDLKSAQSLNVHLHHFYSEEQLFRIDHYLGKETVQNIMVTRFVNGFYEPVWNRNFIERVEITATENIGVENRGGYYDSAGALRDMVQNHLLHLLSYVAMEPPASADPKAIHNEVLKVFQCLRIISADEVDKFVIRGQYTESKIAGKPVTGYRQEQGVSESSKTETYVAIKAFIDNWRWADVPFYIRTGKRMPTRVTEVVIYFRPAPYQIFCTNREIENQINQLIIRIQPDEGLLLKFGMKVPGSGFMVQPVNMDFHYSNLDGAYIPSAYERLLLDCMNNDSTLYSRSDAVEATWRFLEPIQYAWKQADSKVFGYPAGIWGPETANMFFDKRGQIWRYPCKNLTNDGEYCEL
jgi:glucose-6-phosphate 1-dehydrogenase